MQTHVTTEKTYSVGYFKPGQKSGYGISVSVSGDKMKNVRKQAKELLLQAQADALEVYSQFYSDKVEGKEETETD